MSEAKDKERRFVEDQRRVDELKKLIGQHQATALKISDMRDLLTAEEQRKLDADLREMARRRRKAFDDSANIPMA